jgi:hypothetical protein
LIIAKELPLPSAIRLDLLGVDREGALVVIELKRDDSGTNVEWQAIKYASYCSGFSQDEIYTTFAEHLGTDSDDAQVKIEEYLGSKLENLNDKQRIILVSKEFHSDVVPAVLWLRESEIDITCVRLTPHLDEQGNLFVDPEIIIPLPEAKDYLEKKTRKEIGQKGPIRSSFSLERSHLPSAELKERLIESLTRPTDLTPRFRAFLEMIMEEDRRYPREEIKQGLFDAGFGTDLGQAGRYLSGISQFLTKKSNPHLGQAIEFDSGGGLGETKDNYHVISECRDIVLQALKDTNLSEPERS